MHPFQLRVYYEDTDLAGIVYYANYLKFIERGRSEYLRQLGIDQAALHSKGVVFAVVELNCRYIRPAKYDDLLVVETKLGSARGASFTLEQSVLRRREVLFTAKVRLGVVDSDGRPRRLPSEMLAVLGFLKKST